MKCKLSYRILLTLVVFFYCHSDIYAFQEDTAYTKVITQRAAKIVSSLRLDQADKESRVTGIIASQYRDLKAIHDAVPKLSDTIKEKALKALHVSYLAKLKKVLSEPEIEKVKDGMTYSVLPVTFTAYQDMIPSLNAAQKQQIYTWLLEAREYAMDAESSEKKHWWFGKYKGRINNYLSSAGIDMKKEEAAWQQRIKDKKAASAKK
jgi:hypothetical protein